MLNTPVLFLIFNRLDTTKEVFKIIKKVKPKRLYVAADGPRVIKEGEVQVCKEVREYVISNIDWECKVETLFRNENLGCGKAVSEAITWFFDQVSEGIILEDDTLPDISFFSYCENLLDKYRDDSSVMHISGCYFLKNFENNIKDPDSYYFTKHIHVWGWASWRRAWKLYDFSMKSYPVQKKNLKNYHGKYFHFWEAVLRDTYEKHIDTWDFQWMYCIFINKGVSINPTKNLIQNIGFGENATHTKDANSVYNFNYSESISNVRHIEEKKIHERRDELYYKHFLNVAKKKSMVKKVLSKIFRTIRSAKIEKVADQLSIKEATRLGSLPRYKRTETIFCGKQIRIADATTFLSSYREIFKQEIYKFHTNETVPEIIDCGANIGLATIYFKQLFPAAKVDAFEPDPDLYKIMQFNISSLGLTNVNCLNNAISNTNATLLFLKEGGHSGMLVDSQGDDVVNVQAVRLKDFLEKKKYVNFLKIDIEGHEFNVLSDIKEQLAKVEYLFVEYHSFMDKNQVLGEMLELLTECGFKYYLKEAYDKRYPFLQKEIFLGMDLLVNIFCYRA